MIHETVSNTVPASINDVIMKNRDVYSLKMAWEEDFNEFPSIIELLTGNKAIKATITDWHVIRFDKKIGNENTDEFDESFQFMVGFKNNKFTMTSQIQSIDTDNNLVLTSNSFYRLGERSTEDLSEQALRHICYAFWHMGLGNRLGVPKILG